MNCMKDGTPPFSPHIDHPTSPDKVVTTLLLTDVKKEAEEEVSGRLTSN